jgi:hypothetical protein
MTGEFYSINFYASIENTKEAGTKRRHETLYQVASGQA